MTEYTYDDIIIDPKDPRLEGAIGKEVYAGSPYFCKKNANENGESCILTGIWKEDEFPFSIGNGRWAESIILKKEPSHEERQSTKEIKNNDIKIGDMVIASGDIKYTLGLIGTVQNIDYEGWCKVYFNDLSTYFWYPKDCLERVFECKGSKYVSFDLSKEEDRTLLKGRWIFNKIYNYEAMITVFKYDNTEWKVYIPQQGLRTGEQLLNNYVFDDGKPCGKEMKKC